MVVKKHSPGKMDTILKARNARKARTGITSLIPRHIVTYLKKIGTFISYSELILVVREQLRCFFKDLAK